MFKTIGELVEQRKALLPVLKENNFTKGLHVLLTDLYTYWG